MRPLRLKAHGFRGFSDLDLEFPEGLWSIVGTVKDAPPGVNSNGAGKSSLVLAVDLCLFGAERRSLVDYVTHGGEELEIELTFEHAGEAYRARRYYSKRTKQGKPAFDLEKDSGGEWLPLTRETIPATEQLVIDLLGFNREMFRSSSMLLQNEPAFPNLDPKERKQVIVAGLGLGRWADAQERVRSDRRQRETRVAELNATLERADQDLSRLPEVERDVATLTEAVAGATEEHERAEQVIADTAERYRTAEAQIAARKAAEAKLGEATTTAGIYTAQEHDADLAAGELPDLEERIGRLALLVTRGGELADQSSDLLLDRNAWQLRKAERERLEDEQKRLSALAADLRDKADHLEAHIDESAPCDRCGQLMGEEAARRAVESFRTEAATFTDQAAQKIAQAASVVVGDEPPTPGPIPDDVQHAPGELGAARERKAALEARVAAAQEPDFHRHADEARAALAEAEYTLARLPEVEQGAIVAIQAEGLKARAELNEARKALDEQQALKVRAETELARLRTLDVEAARDRYERELTLAGLADLLILDEAFGRDGVSALIVERVAVPVIEERANTILQQFGIPCRLELRTQRETQAGATREALDIVLVWDDASEQEFLFFSGGEKSRIDLALRLGFAELLASRRNAPSDFLCVDEPSYLDSAGAAALVEILRDANQRIPVVCLISHDANLRDAFDTVVEVERTAGVSRVVGCDREPVVA